MPASAISIGIRPHLSGIVGALNDFFLFLFYDFCSDGVFVVSAYIKLSGSLVGSS